MEFLASAHKVLYSEKLFISDSVEISSAGFFLFLIFKIKYGKAICLCNAALLYGVVFVSSCIRACFKRILFLTFLVAARDFAMPSARWKKTATESLLMPLRVVEIHIG